MRFPHAALWAFLLLLGALPLRAQPLPADLALVTINPGQNLPGVVGVRHAGDGSDRLFAIVRTGQIRIFDDERDLLATPFLNLQADSPPLGFTVVGATGGDERGLLGLAFHPLYAINGRFYVYYLDGASNSVVTEYTVSAGNANVADPASARVILRVFQPFTNHNGGDIHFGADGYLYVGLGDGGSGNDPCESGQALTSGAMSNSASCIADAAFTGTPPAGVPQGQAASRALLGKMLRIDVDSTDTPAGADLCGADPANRRYGIPADNPFAGDAGGNAAACDEIYHYGLRNPYRFSFDRDTHDLIIGDVGQGTFEEVDLVPPAGGLNFGWKVCEGFNQRGSTGIDCPLAGATDPILTYGRDLGVSITGGFRYRGPYTALQGVYFYADAYFSTVFYARETAGSWTGATWLNNQGTVVGFGEDEAGHLYLTTLAGQVKRFTLPQGDVEVTKTATLTTDGGTPGVADAGDVITYAVSVQNIGSRDVTDLAVEDSFGGGAPQPLACTPVATLAPGATATCTAYTYTVTQDDIDAGIALVNVAQAVAQTAEAGEVGDSDAAEVSVAPGQSGLDVLLDATLDDADESGAASAGEDIVYTFAVRNTGNVRVHDVVLVASLTGPATCTPTTLDPGATADCGSATHTVTPAEAGGGVDIVNVAQADASAPDDSPVSGSAQAQTPVDGAPGKPALALAGTMTLQDDADGDGLVDEGDSVVHVYTVENTGEVDLAAVAVDSTLHGDVACVPAAIAPGQTATCTSAAYVATAADAAQSALGDTAVAQGEVEGGGAPVQSEPLLTALDVDRPDALFADGFEGG
ncbi:DUF7507 domain-containing protein [Chiayiivirga flava]|uniref:Putative repeat protein (TIGR01451 family) n=1 Tax=Chiayiivirga flava TaxID=659595 RepID=A0A7W8G1D0_9GAMM|nr:PQQ-dependent sugar dehydrogenase [Chiayiivirga flava]MBB5207515.1 putative repeat protein (TIGR01451 family) [Chiayiivirga flava]